MRRASYKGNYKKSHKGKFNDSIDKHIPGRIKIMRKRYLDDDDKKIKQHIPKQRAFCVNLRSIEERNCRQYRSINKLKPDRTERRHTIADLQIPDNHIAAEKQQ
jgi:hypothetical protein